MSGQSVEPRDGYCVGSCDEDGGDVFGDVLTGLFLQIAIERFNATRKSRSIVLVTERRNFERIVLLLQLHQGRTNFR